MREIKFRAWDVRSEEMQDWNHLVGYCDLSYLTQYQDGGDDLYHVIPMQFTGLTDKNGVEIYEGDIVRGVRDNPAWITPMINNVEIKFNAPSFCIGDMSLGDYLMITYEVIGNKYQNPELLEGDE